MIVGVYVGVGVLDDVIDGVGVGVLVGVSVLVGVEVTVDVGVGVELEFGVGVGVGNKVTSISHSKLGGVDGVLVGVGVVV